MIRWLARQLESRNLTTPGASDGVQVQRRATSNAADLGRRTSRASGCGFFVWPRRVPAGVSDRQSSNQRRTTNDTMTTKSRQRQHQPPRVPEGQRRHRRAARRRARQLPGGAFAQAAGPEVKGAKLGFIALTDASPLIIAKEKGSSPSTACPTSRCRSRPRGARRATTWCSAPKANGIDGAHILTPMPYLITTGKVTQNNSRCRCTSWRGSTSTARASRSPTNTRTSRSASTTQPLKEAFDEEEGRRQGGEGRHDLPRRHPRPAGSATGSPPAASIPTRTSRPSSCRRRRWWRT